MGFKDMCGRGEQGRVEGSAGQGGENVLARGGAEMRRGLKDEGVRNRWGFSSFRGAEKRV